MGIFLGVCGCACTGGDGGGQPSSPGVVTDPNWRHAGQVYFATRLAIHIRHGLAPGGPDLGERFLRVESLDHNGDGRITEYHRYTGLQTYLWTRNDQGMGTPNFIQPYTEADFEADAELLLNGQGSNACQTLIQDAEQHPQFLGPTDPYTQSNPDGSQVSSFLTIPAGDTVCGAVPTSWRVAWHFFKRAKGTAPASDHIGNGEKVHIERRVAQMGFWDPDEAHPPATAVLWHYTVPDGTWRPDGGNRLPANAVFSHCEELDIENQVQTIDPPEGSGYILIHSNTTGSARCGVVDPPPITTPIASAVNSASQGTVPGAVRVRWYNDEPWLKHEIWRTTTANWNPATAQLLEAAHETPDGLTGTRFFFGSFRPVYFWTYDDPTAEVGTHYWYWIKSYAHADNKSGTSTLDPRGSGNEGWRTS